MGNQPNPDSIMQLGLGFWGSKTLLTAVELGVFTELSKQELTLDTLIGRFNLNPRSAGDFFDTLVALGLLERRNGMYFNSKEADLFLDEYKPSYVGGMLKMANARLYRFWGGLTEALLTGKPQNELKDGDNFFTTVYSEQDRLKGFLKAMTAISFGANVSIAEKFPWGDYSTFIDIGTAEGGLPVQVALANKHISGGGFDLPEVKPIFNDYIRSLDLSDRLKFYIGNFFEDPLPEAEVLVMGHILQDWNREEKHLLLKKAYSALPSNGALIIYDSIIDDERTQNAFGLLMSLNMLIETPGGFLYTGKECESWLLEAGFRKTKVEHLVGPDSMVIGFK
jgi:hypothetical protein